jgi:membrane protein DedA with SNARE-associated domain
VLDSLVDLVAASPWAYAAILGIAALDAVFPLVPSETTVITGGVLAAAGELSLPLVVAAGAAGALGGDSTSYLAGGRLGGWAKRRLFRGERGRRSLGWAERTLEERGGLLIVVARFVPGGRTAVTFTAGLVRFAAPRFVAFAALGAAGWATYASLIGYLGGRAFEDETWKALLAAFAIAAAVTLLVEAVRRARR